MKETARRFRVIGSGAYLPKDKVSSEALAERINFKSLEKVSTARDVPFRYFATPEENQSQMGAQAILEALSEAGLKPNDLDLIISASASQHQIIPCTAAAIQRDLGLGTSSIPCFDVNSTCLSFVNALDIASRYLQCGGYRRIAVVSSEVPSRFLNWSDSHTAFLFGDGAGAFILEADPTTEGGVVAFHMKTYSSGFDACQIRAGGTNLNFRSEPYNPAWNAFEMDGKSAFLGTIEHVQSFIQELFSKANTNLDEIDTIVPHQMSKLGLAFMENRLDFGSRMVNYFHQYGNQVAAAIPCAWHRARREGHIKSGSRVLIVGSSAGLSLGGAIVVMS